MKLNNKNRDNNNKSSLIFTKETLGTTLLLFSAIIFLMLLTRSTVFAGFGTAICTFMYGTFGYGSYLVLALLAYLGEWLVFGKKIKISLKPALVIVLSAVVFFLLFHAVSSRNISLASYGGYIAGCYKNAAKGLSGYTFGGVISAILVYPVAKLTTFVGAYVIYSLLIALCGYLLFLVFRHVRPAYKGGVIVNGIESDSTVKPQTEKKEDKEPQIVRTDSDYYYKPSRFGAKHKQPAEKRAVGQDSIKEENTQENLGRKILFENGEFAAESYRRNMIFSDDSYFNHPVQSESDYLSSFSSGKKSVTDKPYSESYQDEVLNRPASSSPSNYVYGEKPVEKIDGYEQVTGDVYSVQDTSYTVNKPVETDESSLQAVHKEEAEHARTEQEFAQPAQESYENELPAERDEYLGHTEQDVVEAEAQEEDSVEEPEQAVQPTQESGSVNMYNLFNSSSVPRGEQSIEPDITRISSRRSERSNANLFDDDTADSDDEDDDSNFSAFPYSANLTVDEDEPEEESPRVGFTKATRTMPSVNQASNIQAPKVEPQAVQTPVQEEKPKHVWKKYVHPTLDLLDDYPEHSNVNTGEIEDSKRTIEETLARFKISSEVSNVTIGPAITRYDVIIEDKTKIKHSLNYREAIAMALMKENVTAYLNYSKGALSIEVPNNARTIVGLKSMLASQKFINSKSNALTFALGKNVEGEVVCPDITKMPHLLVAGTTGSGKSICLSALIVSLLYKYGPEELRFILVDPKQVEFISYDKLPHLMINEIIHDVDKAIKALNWAIKEMERRYGLFKDMTEAGRATKNLDEYNSHLPEGEEKLPKIVIILDEFGDLMLQAKKDIEGRIIKLVQKARACGIHLILATQRPSVDCITGLIKSNLPTRIGFKVNSFDDARTIFDIGGAEKLLGKGDMYFRSAENPDLTRIQGCFIDTHEVQKVTDYVKEHNETYFEQSVSDFINKVEEETSSSVGGGEETAPDGDAKIDDTYIKALYYCVSANQASVSMIQRRFPVGYIKACKIIDWMENMNYITQSEGSKPRKVLMTKEEFVNTYGEIDD